MAVWAHCLVLHHFKATRGCAKLAHVSFTLALRNKVLSLRTSDVPCIA
jgi:hypothetical protein